MSLEQISELHDWRIKNGTNWGVPNSHKSKKGTKNANGKGKLKKGIQDNNARNKIKQKVVVLFKATATKTKEEAENDDGMTAKICEALISSSYGNKALKANGGPKNDAMVSAMKLRAIIKNHEISDLS